MKPLVVLALVLAAVTALVVALFAISGSGKVRETADRTVAAPRQPGEGERPPEQSLTRTEARTEPAPAEPEPPRREVETAADSFSNRLTGIVTDPDGKPLPGARITLRQQSSTLGQLAALQRALVPDADDKPVWQDTTNGEGRFQFRSIPPGSSYALFAEHRDFPRAERPYVDVKEQGETQENVQFVRGYTADGYVRDTGGAPIAEAQLLLDAVIYFSLPAGSTSPELQEARTDASGYYRFPNVAAGSRNLTCIAKGYGTRVEVGMNFADDVSKPVTRDFTLEPGRVIAGRVLAPNRSPLGGVQLEAINYEAALGSRGFARTDASGSFRVEDLATGTYQVVATFPGYSQERRNRVEAGETNMEIVLSQQGCAMGRVVDAGDGHAITSFSCSVRVATPGATAFGRPSLGRDVSSPEGAFEICALEPGRYVVQAGAPGYALSYSEPFTVTQAMTTPDVIVRLGKGSALRGRLVDATTGAPVVGAEIGTFDNSYVKNPFTEMFAAMMPRNTTEQRTRSDREGRFNLALLTPEVYQVQIAHRSYTTMTLTDLRLVESGDQDLGTLEMLHGATVRGTVYGADGRPLPNATVSLRGNSLALVYNARTDAEGRYISSNIAAGALEISAMRPTDTNANPFDVIIDMKNSQVALTVAEGRDYTQDLYLGRD